MANIEIIGVPLDLGADRRGVDMGPSAIRYAGLSEKLRAARAQGRRQGKHRHADRRSDQGRALEGEVPF